MNYREACSYIDNIVKFTSKHSNEHTRECLELLGNPDRDFPSIHIAGTNGKGSTAAFLASVLKESGRKTGLFTSPHLVRVNERIRIDGREIDDDSFVHVFEKVRTASVEMEKRGEGHPSYFEFLFLMAMAYFSEQNVEAAVVETGLGGRLDATNALEHPALCVITSIGMDHMQYLGNTIEEIAGEKAGILKPGTPCVYAADNEAAAMVIAARAEELDVSAKALRENSYHAVRNQGGTIDFLTAFGYDNFHEFRTRSCASYQAENGALAVLALKTLRESDPGKWKDISGDTVRRGIYAMFWPGRMEEIRPHVWLDGAHNDNGIRRFLESVKGILGEKSAGLLFAVVNDKDFTDMIRDLVREVDWDYIIVSEAGGERSTDAGEIGELFRAAGAKDVTVIRNPEEAFAAAEEKRGADELFICGSLYLVGQALSCADREDVNQK